MADWSGLWARAAASDLGFEYREDDTGAYLTPRRETATRQPLRFDTRRAAIDWLKAQRSK